MKIGERVDVIDETVSGVITALSAHRVTLETDEGFSFTYARDEVVKVKELSVSAKEVRRAKKEKKSGGRKKTGFFKKNIQKRPMVVDLHSERLASTTKNMSDHEILGLQLRTARGKLEFAIEEHILRIVFIHGVGKGVLRMELETLFRRYDQVEYYDAAFSQYGHGATEVYIHQNP